MCRLGASVVGIDASKKNIEVAKFHAKKNKLKIDYKIASPEMLKDKKKFDVILNMEIVEHVNDIDFFINSLVVPLIADETTMTPIFFFL